MYTDVKGTIAYIAPEVLKKLYNKKCDIWSCGVVMFALLTGQLPFSTKEDVLNCKIAYPSSYSSISEEAKAMISFLLHPDPTIRPTAEEALCDPWFDCYVDSIDSLADTKLQTRAILNNLIHFSKLDAMKIFAMFYIINNVMDMSTYVSRSNLFQQIDTDYDGLLSLKEFTIASTEAFEKDEYVSMASELLFTSMDSNKSGHVKYSEFIAATIGVSKVLTKEQIVSMHTHIDINKTGNICAEKFLSCVGMTLNSKYEAAIKEILQKDNKYYLSAEDFLHYFA